MTAFSRTTGQTPWGEITCELRSVNHRYLEISPRLSDEVRSLEPVVRDKIGQRIKRGRIDCTIRLQQQDLWVENLELDSELIGRLAAVSGQIRSTAPDTAPLRVVDVLRWPGVVKTVRLDEEQVGTIAMDCLDEAVGRLISIREREGEKLLGTLKSKLAAAQAIVDELVAALPDWRASFRGRIEKRLAEARVELDPARVEQEIVLYLQKADVTEEVDRLVVHLGEVSRVFGHKQPVGRRLDFLMQELNREANTLGSKSFDTRVTQASVELKVLIEQMREQVQNIE